MKHAGRRQLSVYLELSDEEGIVVGNPGSLVVHSAERSPCEFACSVTCHARLDSLPFIETRSLSIPYYRSAGWEVVLHRH